MKITTKNFLEASTKAITNQNLQKALGNLRTGFQSKRLKAKAALPEFDELTQQAADVKDEVINNLDIYLQRFEDKVIETGGKVHWASDAEAARQAVLSICNSVNANTVTKGKSMVTEEINLNDFLEKNGIQPIETDLGEYILQLRGDHPSHIIAPAIHLNLEDVSSIFAEKHQTPKTSDAVALLQQARSRMREHFTKADVGITGANFCIAETGSTIIVTNEGNGDLTQTLPGVHIVVTSIDKVIPNLEDMSLFLRLLARSATGQEFAVYNTLSTGPRRMNDKDGPDQFHVVLVDNGRSSMVGSKFQPMLRCIRCSACMNNCPVYGAVGGHAYGWVYPGPMGAVLTPQFLGIKDTSLLPDASTLCGKCEEVCPVKIPLPSLMRYWREQAKQQKLDSFTHRWAFKIWGFAANHHRLYHFTSKLAVGFLRRLAGSKGSLKTLPFASSWSKHRDIPTPEGKTFMQQLKTHKNSSNE